MFIMPSCIPNISFFLFPQMGHLMGIVNIRGPAVAQRKKRLRLEAHKYRSRHPAVRRILSFPPSSCSWCICILLLNIPCCDWPRADGLAYWGIAYQLDTSGSKIEPLNMLPFSKLVSTSCQFELCPFCSSQHRLSLTRNSYSIADRKDLGQHFCTCFAIRSGWNI